jgi:hypothetical protein
MSLTKVNISQNKRQSPINGERSLIGNICIFFMCEYLHLSQIILNTHLENHYKKYFKKTSIVSIIVILGYMIRHFYQVMFCRIAVFFCPDEHRATEKHINQISTH